MGNSMNEDINPEILKKIKESSQPENIKQFLYEILDLEYEHSDEKNPKLKNPYHEYIKHYKR